MWNCVGDKKDNEEGRAPLEYLPRGPRLSSYATAGSQTMLNGLHWQQIVHYPDVINTAVDKCRLIVGAVVDTAVVQRRGSKCFTTPICSALKVDSTRCWEAGVSVDRCIRWCSDVVRGRDQLVRHTRTGNSWCCVVAGCFVVVSRSSLHPVHPHNILHSASDKKFYNLSLPSSSPNINRFSKVFQWNILRTICNKMIKFNNIIKSDDY